MSVDAEQSTEGMRRGEDRPWGSWMVLEVGDGYQVKRIVVRPNQRLSLQTHVHRSEHWVVVRGTATCTVGARRVCLAEGETTAVPRGTAHRIANEGSDDLLMVEVQLGAYTGEDDIVRLSDDYGR